MLTLEEAAKLIGQTRLWDTNTSRFDPPSYTSVTCTHVTGPMKIDALGMHCEPHQAWCTYRDRFGEKTVWFTPNKFAELPVSEPGESP